MAEHLASIFGTEKDRVNCPFYFKIGACRHGDRCSRLHNKPTISPTLLLQNMYQNPILNAPLGADGLPVPVDPKKVQEFFEDFYEDIFEELAKYGEIEYLNVCDNLADHMVGNCYVKFRDEDAAARALQALQGRFYAGKPIHAEFSPVTDFREATCRQYEEGTCGRGGYCNFMHVRPVSKSMRKQLFGRFRDGTGGSTRFHDNDRPRDRGGFRGGDRYASRYDDRGPRRFDRDRGAGGGGGSHRTRDSSAERRANIARWNAEAATRGAGGGDQGYTSPAAGSGYAPPVPEVGGGYAPPVPVAAGGYAPPVHGSYAPAPAMPAATHQPAYGMPQPAAAFSQPMAPSQPAYNGYGGGYGGRGGGGSGANTIPIANPRTFAYQQQQ